MNLSSDKRLGKICQHHFQLSAFANNKYATKKVLNSDAIPTIISVEVIFCLISRLHKACEVHHLQVHQTKKISIGKENQQYKQSL